MMVQSNLAEFYNNNPEQRYIAQLLRPENLPNQYKLSEEKAKLLATHSSTKVDMRFHPPIFKARHILEQIKFTQYDDYQLNIISSGEPFPTESDQPSIFMRDSYNEPYVIRVFDRENNEYTEYSVDKANYDDDNYYNYVISHLNYIRTRNIPNKEKVLKLFEIINHNPETRYTDFIKKISASVKENMREKTDENFKSEVQNHTDYLMYIIDNIPL